MKVIDLIEQLIVMQKNNPDGELLYHCDCCSQYHVFKGDILSFDDQESDDETQYLLSTKANRDRLLAAIAEYKDK